MSLPKLKIDEIHVRIIPDEELVTLNFMVGDHFHTMRRDSKESMKKALIRFTKTVDKTIDKNNAWEKKKLAKANKNDNHHSKSSNHSNHYNSSNEIDDHTNVNHKSNDNRHDNSADNSTIHKNYDVYSVEKALEVSNRVYNTLDAETSEITDHKDNKVVKIFKDNIPIDISNKTNSDYEDNTILVYGSIHYKIQINPPAVTTLKVHPNHTVLVGCPIVPTVTTEFANDVNYQWCRETAPNSDEYIPVSTDEIYFPQDDAVNCKIKLYATAIRSDDTATANSTVYGRATVLYVTDMIHPSVPCLNRMLQVRSNYISIKKHLQQNDQQLEKSFRVTTYNILAEPFATSDNSINHIFSYVNSSYLDTNYRIQRIQAEIISYESDILCLQECDHKLFDGYYLPLLKQQYYGYHTNKSSSVLEGCATFISTKSFRVITKFELALKDILRSSTELQRIYEYRPDLKTILGRKVGTIVQITICQSKYDSSQIVVVANSHLYYHPAADLVRYIQMHTIVRIVSDIMSTISMEGIPALSTMKIPGMMSPTVPCTDFQTTDELKVSAIFLGDLNSSLGSAAVEYLESGSATIKSTLHSWRTVQELNWKRSIDDGDVSGNEEQEIVESIDSVKISSNSNSEEIRPFVSLLDIPGIEKELQSLNLNNKETRDILQLIPGMSHQLSLISSTGKLKYTNYTDTYKECLDHIFITNKNLEVVRVAEQPSEEILAEEIALPSSVFPSDHISLSVDLKFKQ